MKSDFKNLPSGWRVVRLGEISSRITRRNQDNRCQNVLTISAQSGLISQTDFFNKQVASKDLSSYILLRKGDFAYNKSYSTGYSFGAFKRLKFYDEGVASPLYIYFKFNDDICSDFFEFYFDGGQANRQIKDIVQEGARNHGLLNLSIDDFFNIKLCMPPLDEQEKIAEILSTWDDAINLTINLIENKKQFKKALMQNLLTAKIRFPEFKDEWQKIKMNDIVIEIDERSTTSNQYEILSVTLNGIVPQNTHFKKSIASQDNTGYKILRYGNLVIGMNLWMGGLDVLINKDIGIVSPAYRIFKIDDGCNMYFLKNFIKTKKMLKLYVLHSEQGASIVRRNLNLAELLEEKIKLPNLKEQQKIAEVLTACDDEINLLNLKLENLKKQKQGLMQKLLNGEARV